MPDLNNLAEASGKFVDAFVKLRDGIRGQLISSIITACLISFFGFVGYAGYHIIHEGEVLGGLRIAFVTSDADAAAHAKALHDAKMQAEIEIVAHANALANQRLDLLLSEVNSAIRVRVAVIHNGTTVSGNNAPLLKWDILYARAIKGRSEGTWEVNRTLATWDYLEDYLLKGKCYLQWTKDLRSAEVIQRMNDMGVVAFLVVPVAVRGNLIAALYLSWDDAESVPTGEALEQVKIKALLAAGEIGGFIDLRNTVK